MTAAKTLVCFTLFFFAHLTNAQSLTFTKDDTLRGSITPQRAWWDLTFYHLKVKVNPADKSISGSNEIQYTVLYPGNVLQIDLQPPLHLERAEQDGQILEATQQGRNAYFIALKKEQPKGSRQSLTVWYSGIPQAARNAPWDGGFSWEVEDAGQPFIATSCQGLGASVWWPCKDHAYDEPDSQAISVTVPNDLTDVSNGRLRRVTNNGDGTHTFDWFVANPINNYGVNVNIARYAHIADTFQGEKGLLSLDYYVLPQNLEKAKLQFQQVKLMLTAFEHWFGPYPFYEDGYKLVQVPYLGMEHQSSVTYGNRFMNGYLGRDLSGTGWGMKWDYIIVHESGHEWFANNITYRDIADMWIHEGFTNYSEALYTEYYFGKQAGTDYIKGLRGIIRNTSPIVGTHGVNSEGSPDMYPKGANLLHTIRQIVDDDEKWRSILRGLNRDFYHQTVYGTQVEDYITQHSGKKLQKVFDQYLRNSSIPILEYTIKKGRLKYHWVNCIDGFDMPVKVTLSPGKNEFIYPTTKWKSSRCKLPNKDDFQVEESFYVVARRL
ncbi:MAG: M1 family metallopeptidase [Phycisphaerae bacterium]|nr:M1 family metallopeptidase [Saprospiraceae bacterium]